MMNQSFLLSLLLLVVPATVTTASLIGTPIAHDAEVEQREALRRLRTDAGTDSVGHGGPRKLREHKQSHAQRSLPYVDDAYFNNNDDNGQTRYYDDDGYRYTKHSGKQGMGRGKSGMSGGYNSRAYGGKYGNYGKSGKSGMGKSGMGTTRGYYGKSGKSGGAGSTRNAPALGDIAFLDDNFFDDNFFYDDECQLVSLNETFGIPGASLFLAPDTTLANPGTPELPGTVFIFELNEIFEMDGVTPLDGTSLSGTCTRTTVGDTGGGICSLVFIDDAGFSINVNGYLPGPFGGPLAITGGTGGLVGVVGEMDFFPVYENTTNTGDIFLDAIRYEVIADLGLIVCPPN